MVTRILLVLTAACILHGAHGLVCRIRPMDRESVQYLQDYSVMYIFELEIYNGTDDPLKSDVSLTYKPWKWYRTISDHGKTLLTLSFNYDVLSMSILTIGIQRVPLKLKDYPGGCFKNLTAEERVDLIRERVFDNFKRKRDKTTTEVNEEMDARMDAPVYVCNEIIRNENGYAEFAHKCCVRDSNDKIVCSDHEDNVWISVLYVCITLVKVMLFMFGPLLIPANMYTASYVSSEYVVKLTKEIKMKMFVSESTTTSVRYKHRLTADEISQWRRFRDSINELPMDQITNVKVPELRINVKGKRVIPANEPPTGLLRTIYDNLIRCKIRSLDPFKSCCNESIYGSLQPLIKHKCTWEDIILVLVKVIVLMLVPFPFYIRLYIYYRFEEQEFEHRNQMVSDLGLQQAFNPYRMNLLQYLTPTHALFLATYTFYFLSGVVIGFSGECVRDKLKSIVRAALHDMEHVSRTSVLQIVLAVLLWPFKKCGLLAVIGFPIFCFVAGPACVAVFTLYCIPTVYLAYRLIFHCRKQLGSDTEFLESDKPLGKTKQKVKNLHKKLVKIDKNVHTARDVFVSDEEKQSPCMYGYGKLFQFYRFLLQVLVSLFCLIILVTSLLLFVEAIGVFVEIIVFTMMGIIVNAGSTLRYVSMALLVIVYMHNCYNNVYENYLTFNGVVMDEITDRVRDALQKVASLPSSMQENVAFQVKPVEACDEISTSLNLEKKDPQWKIGHLLLFLDSFDTPRIPLNLFKKLCEVRVHGAPGPVYINLLLATGKFSIIVVFLFFVMLVVMAFGSANQMSSTNQTLATMAGGFVPMLLKNVLSTKSAKLNLKTLSFKGQIDEIVAEYKQHWPIYDFVVEEYDPLAEEAEKEKEDEKKDGDKNDKEKSDSSKDKSGDGDKKDDDKEKDKAKSPFGSTLQLPGQFHDSLEDVRPVEVKGPHWLRRLSMIPMDDNQVDLFIDLSSAEESNPWQWLSAGSSGSIESMTMLNEMVPMSDYRMPYDQTSDANRNNGEVKMKMINGAEDRRQSV